MHNTAGIATVVVAAGALCAFCGCSSGERYQSEKEAEKVEAPLPVATHFQVIDVPVPGPFRFDRRRSLISKKPDSNRQITLIYTGRTHIERAARFYREQMTAPIPGWKLEDDQMRGKRYVLVFAKGKERCRVTVEPGSLGSVKVTVDIN
jgi:hypothetical protein